MKRTAVSAFAAAALLLASCSGPGETAGTGHGGEARVSGIILDSGSVRVAHALVRLLPASANPAIDSGYTTWSNDSGYYTFDEVPPGNYTLSAFPSSSDTTPIVYRRGIAVSPDIEAVELDTARPPGFGTVLLDSIPDSLRVRGMILRIDGTPLSFYCGDSARRTISVPAGTVTLSAWRIGDTRGTTVLNELLIRKDDTVSFKDEDINHATGRIGVIYFFSRPVTETELFWKADWDDGTSSPWTSEGQLHHSYSIPDSFSVRYAVASVADTAASPIWIDAYATGIIIAP